jgi:hypothetical protein
VSERPRESQSERGKCELPAVYVLYALYPPFRVELEFTKEGEGYDPYPVCNWMRPGEMRRKWTELG